MVDKTPHAKFGKWDTPSREGTNVVIEMTIDRGYTEIIFGLLSVLTYEYPWEKLGSEEIAEAVQECRGAFNLSIIRDLGDFITLPSGEILSVDGNRIVL